MPTTQRHCGAHGNAGIQTLARKARAHFKQTRASEPFESARAYLNLLVAKRTFQLFSSHNRIVKLKHAARNQLIILVALARN